MSIDANTAAKVAKLARIEVENQDLFEVVFNEKRILIPLVDEFVVNIDNDNKKIIMNLPEGITDL